MEMNPEFIFTLSQHMDWLLW